MHLPPVSHLIAAAAALRAEAGAPQAEEAHAAPSPAAAAPAVHAEAGMSASRITPTRAVEPTQATERVADAVAQGLSPVDAGASQQVAAPALTAMALSSLHSVAMQFRAVVPQEPEAERKRQGGGHEQSPMPMEEPGDDAADDAAALKPARAGRDHAVPLRTQSLHERLLRRLREAPASPAIDEALQALAAGRPLLLAAPLVPPQGLRCDAEAWLFRPPQRGVQPEAQRWTAQMLFARVPRGEACWSWRAQRDLRPTGTQWLPREAGAAALWFGPLAAGAAYSGWREVLLSLPAAPRLQQALAAHYSLQVLISSTPLPAR